MSFKEFSEKFNVTKDYQHRHFLTMLEDEESAQLTLVAVDASGATPKCYLGRFQVGQPSQVNCGSLLNRHRPAGVDPVRVEIMERVRRVMKQQLLREEECDFDAILAEAQAAIGPDLFTEANVSLVPPARVARFLGAATPVVKRALGMDTTRSGGRSYVQSQDQVIPDEELADDDSPLA